MITNQFHGLCKDCITKTDLQYQHHKSATNLCQLCKNVQPDLIQRGQAICIKCYLQNKLKMSELKVKKRKTQILKTQGNQMEVSYRKIDRKLDMTYSILTPSNKTMKLVESLFTKLKATDLLTFLNKKPLIAGNIKWEQLTQKVDRVCPIVYTFIIKNFIIGAFHSEQMKFNKYDTLKDPEIRIFKVDRSNMEVQFFGVKQDCVVYRNKSVFFGNPSSFTINFSDKVSIKTELFPLKKQIEWHHFHVISKFK